MLKIKKIILVLLFCCISLLASTGINYAAVLAIIIFTLISLLFRTELKISFNQVEDLIPLSFLIVWMYGFILGLIRQNNPNYIISNFAGMTVYILYYVLIILRISKMTLFKIAFWGGVTVAIFTIVVFYLNRLGITSLYRRWSSTGQVGVFITILTTAYVPWLYTVARFFMPKATKVVLRSYFNLSSIGAIMIFIICSFSILYISASKGFTLGIIFYIIFAPLLFYLPKFFKGKLNIKLLFFLTFILILFLIYSSLGYEEVVTKVFAKDDISNKARYDQLGIIVNDFTFFGNGLGAVIEGIVRDKAAPYGFELTYINLIHKFGFMSIILFLGWAYMFIKIISRIFVGKELIFNIAAFGALGYLLPSIGNPLLMHPGCVILNCIALYLTRKPLNDPANRKRLIESTEK